VTNHVIILAGGVGSRLYPLSTPEHPKQFLDLLSCGKTLIQLTYERFLAVDPDAEFWVVTSENYTHYVREQLPEIPSGHILSEPSARNTAPCIAYGCWKIKQCCPDANVMITPSDAYVPDKEAFAMTMRSALTFTAASSSIVCLGIEAKEPHTGYGYLHSIPTGGYDIVPVLEFKEKPSLEVAQEYVKSGDYFWNAGIFVWNIATIESEFRTHAPGIAAIMDELSPSFGTPGEKDALEKLFPQCEKISIDYAVMEKSSHVFMAPSHWFWTDLGSFEALEKVAGKKLK